MSHPLDALIALETAPDSAQIPDGPGPRAVTAQTHPAWANMV